MTADFFNTFQIILKSQVSENPQQHCIWKKSLEFCAEVTGKKSTTTCSWDLHIAAAWSLSCI